MTDSTPTPVKRRLRVVEFDGPFFGTDIITLRWRAEDGSIAQRIFEPGVWDVMPDWAERDYEAAVTAHPVTRFDSLRVVQPAPAPPGPAATASDLSKLSAGGSRCRSKPSQPLGDAK